jgi:hypothetical protein
MREFLMLNREGRTIAKFECEDRLMACELASGYITKRMTKRLVIVVEVTEDGTYKGVARVHYDGTVNFFNVSIREVRNA